MGTRLACRGTPTKHLGCDLRVCRRGVPFLNPEGVRPPSESPEFNRRRLTTHPELADLIGRKRLGDRSTGRAN